MIALPAIFRPVHIEIIPLIAPFRCITSEMFGVDTWRSSPIVPSSKDCLPAGSTVVEVDVGADATPWSIASRIAAAERVIAPPTMMTSAPAEAA